MTKCRRCNRTLKNPTHAKLGIGKICLFKENWSKETEHDMPSTSEDIIEPYNAGDDFYMWRVENWRKIKTNVQHLIVRHSPTGLRWGYLGSGPAEMALNILAMLYGAENAKFMNYQKFKDEIIAKIPEKGGVIKLSQVKKWVNNNIELFINY